MVNEILLLGYVAKFNLGCWFNETGIFRGWFCGWFETVKAVMVLPKDGLSAGGKVMITKPFKCEWS